MSFDTLAPHYRWMEFVLAGRKLHDCRTAYLDRAFPAQNILLLGEGNGRFLVECARRFPNAGITCVDASERMLQSARRRILKHGLGVQQVKFTHADALAWNPPPGTFDLIVTHFFLDCFSREQLEKLIGCIGASAMPRARWLLADFQLPAAGMRRCRARIIMRMMYAFFRVVARLPAHEWISPDALLAANGFTLRERRVSEWGLLHSDLWEAGEP
jgi:ubiquinone/menaquinone biosynthesis C-methylase UbiE